MKFRFGAATHMGRVRDHNEDAFLLLEDRGLAMVADGMGGHNAGDVASRLAVEAVEEEFADPTQSQSRGLLGLFRRRSGGGRLVDAIKRANRSILTMSTKKPSYRGMGTTAVAIWWDGEVLHYAHVGDSRLYRLRNGVLLALTEDHSLLNEYLRLGELTQEQAAHFPFKNIITRALGLSPGVHVDADQTQPKPGDRYLLCSDGLTDLVDEEKIRVRLATSIELEEAASELVELALEAGGLDNITAVVAEVSDS